MAPNYRSLVPGGFFSSTPFDRTMPVSIRSNNAGAVNGASWERHWPGYVDTVETTPGNDTTIFETPEYGVAVWWELLRRYAAANVKTVGGIINRYGGGQDYSNYIRFVEKKTGFNERREVPLDEESVLLPFGKAMFAYEAGRSTPLSDEQILLGFKLGRAGGHLTQARSTGFLSTIAGEFSATHGDKACVPRLIELGGDVESLHRIQDTAAKSMKAAGYGYTMHNACAATLSAFLNEAGISIRTTLGAGRLAQRLHEERGWPRVERGKQQAGDVGVAKNDVHIYLVVEAKGSDEMVIADNQAPQPHTRFASGKGKTSTAYFLRAPDEHEMFAALEEIGNIEPSDQDFYPREDEDTSQLVEQVDSEETSGLEKLTGDQYREKPVDAVLKKRIEPKTGQKKV